MLMEKKKEKKRSEISDKKKHPRAWQATPSLPRISLDSDISISDERRSKSRVNALWKIHEVESLLLVRNLHVQVEPFPRAQVLLPATGRKDIDLSASGPVRSDRQDSPAREKLRANAIPQI